MHRPPLMVRLIVLVVVLVLVIGGGWYYLEQQNQQSGPLTASGTIEADTVAISPQVAGRVSEVAAEEGDAVAAGSALVVLDATTLEAQRAQSEAAATAAQAHATALEGSAAVLEQNAAAADAGVVAAQANLARLEAGPTAEQLAIAQAGVDKAQVAVDDLEDAYDELSNAAEDTPAGRQLKLQRDLARADLVGAQAQLDLVTAGARPEELDAARAQLDAAQAQAAAAHAQLDALASQVEAARSEAAAAAASQGVIDSQIAQLTMTSPVAGTVLTRAIEPGEFAAPGSSLLVIGTLDPLTITVYVPEDRYGAISLGQSATVAVDSFPGETFSGTVVHIADQAEFTPRNVQTVEGRKSTVFAIRLEVPNGDGRLKPGMPADVTF